jgi:outer membrane receptor for ferrienterochelin and colicins
LTRCCNFSSALMASVLAVSPAFAQQADEDLSDLEGLLEEDVVTSASKSAETTSTAPATAVTITADELRRHGIRRVDQAILFLGYGATVGERYQPTEFGARGVSLPPDLNSHVLVLLDGHAANSQISGGVHLDQSLGMPIELVDHIEIILGPGSVLYGTNAMLAVVNIVTKRAKDHRGLHFGVETELGFEPVLGGLVRGTTGAGAEFPLLGETAELTLQAEYSYFRQPVDIGSQYLPPDQYTGGPIQVAPDDIPPSGIWGGRWDNNMLEQWAAYSRLIRGRFQLLAAAGSIDRNHPMLQYDFDNPDTREQERWVRLDASHAWTLSTEADLRARVYADSDRKRFLWRSSTPMFCLPGQNGGCRTDLVSGSEWVGTEIQASVDWQSDGQYTTLWDWMGGCARSSSCPTSSRWTRV